MLEGEAEIIDEESECNGDLFPPLCNWLCFKIDLLQTFSYYLINSTIKKSSYSSMLFSIFVFLYFSLTLSSHNPPGFLHAAILIYLSQSYFEIRTISPFNICKQGNGKFSMQRNDARCCVVLVMQIKIDQTYL